MQQRRRGTLTVERSLAGGPSVAPWVSRSREGEERCPAASADHRGRGVGGRQTGGPRSGLASRPSQPAAGGRASKLARLTIGPQQLAQPCSS
jgi:hypothetical protein